MDRIGAGYIKSFWQIRIFFMILLRRKLPVLTGLDLWSMVMKMFRIENISIVKCCILDNFAWSEISATLSWLNREVTWKKKWAKNWTGSMNEVLFSLGTNIFFCWYILNFYFLFVKWNILIFLAWYILNFSSYNWDLAVFGLGSNCDEENKTENLWNSKIDRDP